ncbi:MAG: Lrp/AsnC family transcriptional regulator [Meiothermus silvanus]|nr:Lrp/AsnC family transcriptional regulator [Allomeiothermus silvanus]
MALEHDRLLDETGWEILELLQQDARVPFSELGRKVGLSAPAVAERVRRMEDAGIITGYRAQVNLQALGYAMTAIIRLSSPAEKCTLAGHKLAELPEVLEAHRVTGEDSWVVRVAVRSVEHLERLINQINLYGDSNTAIVLSSAVTQRVIGKPKEQATTPRR